MASVSLLSNLPEQSTAVKVIGQVVFEGARPLEATGDILLFDEDIIALAFPLSKEARDAAVNGRTDPISREIVDIELNYVITQQYLEVLMNLLEDMSAGHLFSEHLQTLIGTPDEPTSAEEVQQTFMDFIRSVENDPLEGWVQSYGVLTYKDEPMRVYFIHPEGNIHGGALVKFIATQPFLQISAERAA